MAASRRLEQLKKGFFNAASSQYELFDELVEYGL